MRMSKRAMMTFKGAGDEARIRLAQAMGVKKHTIWYWLRENKENGPLTTVKAVKVIAEITGMLESEIVEDTKVGLAHAG